MTGIDIDHIVSLVLFLSAMMLFIGLFVQIIQTGVDYQQNNAVASKCSDLLDNIMLSPGIPSQWGQTDDAPTGFGLQDAGFTQYQLSPFSLMRLRSSTGTMVNYTMTGQSYSNISMGFGQSLFVPYSQTLNYSTVSSLLGINGSYGFSLTLTPIVTITIEPQQLQNPLTFSINVTGPGFPLANTNVDCRLITVDGKEEGSYPEYEISDGSAVTDSAGFASLSFEVDGSTTSFALVACAHQSGLVGMGYYSHVLYDTSYVIPLVSSIENETAILAHSWDVTGEGESDAAILYNATFIFLTEDFTLHEMPLDNSAGLLNSGQEPELAYDTLTIGTHSTGILVISYSTSAQDTGIVVMPWGLSGLSFPVTFGGNPNNMDWVAVDLRQVMINGIAYQAKLSVWSLSKYQVNV